MHAPLSSLAHDGPHRRAEPVVAAEHIAIRYDDFVAVDDVSFTIRPGEIVGLLGPNGAGKTSLLETLEGLQKPASGKVTLLGYAPGQLPAARRSEVGFVFQRSALPGHVSVAQLTELYRQTFPDSSFGSHLETTLGLDHLQDRPVSELSVGQRQRLSVFCALYGRPSVLIMDEPTSALDIRSRRSVWDAILLCKRQGGMSGIIATHDMAEAMELCDRVYFIESGRICGELLTSQAAASHKLQLSIQFKAPASFLDSWRRPAEAGLELRLGSDIHQLDCPKAQAASVIADILNAEQTYGFDAELSVRQSVLEKAYLQHIATMG